jgi:hypothetical protein
VSEARGRDSGGKKVRWMIPVASVCLALGTPSSEAADAAAASNIRIGVSYSERPVECLSHLGVGDLSKAYFGAEAGELQALLKDVFACEDFAKLKTEDFKIVLFLAQPTVGSNATIAHAIYSERRLDRLGSPTLPGIGKATWVYITECPRDKVASVITLSPVENPVVAQLGSLATSIESKILERVDKSRQRPLRLHVSAPVDLPLHRSSIAEADFITTPEAECNQDETEHAGEKRRELGGTFNITNAPKAWLTVNAVAAVPIGSVAGAQRIKVENKAYTSDPLPRGMAMVGVTLHPPFEVSSPRVTWQERVGLFVGGVISPAPGVAAGFSLGARGIALTTGYAALLVHTAPKGLKPGDAAVADTSSQLVDGTSRTWFVGLSYAFK